MTGLVLVGAWYGYRGRNDAADAATAASMLPHWPDRAETAARLAPSREDLTTQQAIEEVKRWAASAIARDDRDPRTVGQAGVSISVLRVRLRGRGAGLQQAADD